MDPKTGLPLPSGTPLRSANHLETYVQDTWRLRSDITLSAGVRNGYATPIWEAR